MRKLFRSSNIVVALGASVLLAACAASGTVSGGYGGSGDESAVKELVRNVGDRVFFATDSAALSSDARSTIMRQADWLKTNGKSLTIEGHADERGTREYNIALGARRANAVKDYMISLGVDGSRLETVSWGKERPVSLCAEDACWSKNRRSVSVIQ
ncbi:MAG TPA: peptidoglycan-associated lipoprotein Pal [Rhodobiaceae bacterium]|nr:peptidoglycan-associated lipoprotein Pal [Rhodobiaceae bacterium]|tara:strand:- start:724 stop:1191 length:468 start_codon:yes stop_codon:yes gene_type:complete